MLVEQPVCWHLKVVLLSAKTHARAGTVPQFPPTLPEKPPAHSRLQSVSNWHTGVPKSNWLEQRPSFEHSALSGSPFYLSVPRIHSFLN